MGDGQFDRTPPHNVEAEQVVLGRMMQSAEAAAEAEGLLKPTQFYRPVHATVFETICELASQGMPTDPIAVAETLREAGKLTAVGGAPYLHTCFSRAYDAGALPYYAALIVKKATSRRLLEIAARINQGVYSADGGGDDPDALIDHVRDSLAEIEDGRTGGDGPKVWGELIPAVHDAIDEAGSQPDDQVPGVPTGFIDLDRLLTGFRPGQLIVLAARTSVGKSVAAAGFAQYAACAHKMPALMFSLEMFDVEIGMRLMAAGARVPLNVIMSGKLTDDDWTRVARYSGDTADAPLYIDSSANLTVADIRGRARKLHRQVGLKLIVVDYLQLVETTRSESRQMAVAAVSRGLKLLAMELKVPVIAVAQLNRGPEQRTDKRPTKGDLRESGAIENDADVIIFLHREDYYDKESPRAGEADLIVDKNRNGSTDTVTVAAQLHFSRFVDMAIV